MQQLTQPGSASPWRAAFFGLAALVAVSFIAVETPERGQDPLAASGPAAGQASAGDDPTLPSDNQVAVGGGEGQRVVRRTGRSGAGGRSGGTGAAVGGAASQDGAAQGGGTGGGQFECKAGANGGSTDRGVSGNRIRLAATNVRSDVGASFLGTAFIGMEAVKAKVNAAGGICGRLLDLRLVDDGWDAARGATFLANFTKDDYFALPVVPSSEGLTQAIVNGTISGAGIPVVGSDGMLKEQYKDPWVWPVAAATVSTVRIMAKHASDEGGKTFGIVYDQRYKFGIEGAEAFKQYVGSLPGAQLKAFVGITPEKPDYASEAKAFNDACGGDGCDFVAMLLDPLTANTYISSQSDKGGRRQGFGRLLTGGAQPLFNDRFARDCGSPCEGMLVWTGYNPPVGAKQSLPDVAQYVNDVRSVNPGVDVNNQFLEGAYLGMRVFVAALQKVGPNLTRAALADAMNSLTYESDLAASLSWKADRRCANLTAQAYRITTSGGSFAGFADASTGFRADPKPCDFPS